MAGVAYAARVLCERSFHAADLVTLIITIATGLLAYVSALALFDRPLFRQTLELLTEMRDSGAKGEATP